MSKAVKYVDRWAERVPSVCRAAKPTAWEDVSNIHAVQLTNAQYRGALLSGTFELVDAESPWVTVSGQQRLVLRFYWFGHRPPTRFPAVQVTAGGFRFVRRHTGPVVRNVSL